MEWRKPTIILDKKAQRKIIEKPQYFLIQKNVRAAGLKYKNKTDKYIKPTRLFLKKTKGVNYYY